MDVQNKRFQCDQISKESFAFQPFSKADKGYPGFEKTEIINMHGSTAYVSKNTSYYRIGIQPYFMH